jgi:hypothetical protein
MTDFRKNVIRLTILFLASMIALGNASETKKRTVLPGPERPAVDYSFDFEQEARIQEMAGFTPGEVFESLKETDFMVNENLLNKSVYKALGHRKKAAVDMALDKLRSPVIRRIGGETVSRHADFIVAKKILEVFPDKAANRLPGLYSRGDITTKINVLNVSGRIAGEGAIRNMLLKALDDGTFSDSEEDQEEVAGMPLRICDIAYNQLILRYKIKNVLRTIGTVHAIEIRDYHIEVLKYKLKDLL